MAATGYNETEDYDTIVLGTQAPCFPSWGICAGEMNMLKRLEEMQEPTGLFISRA